MAVTLQSKRFQTKAELLAHWRSAAKEIRSEIAVAGLQGETNQIAQITADMLEACANQLESLPNP